MHLEFNNFVSCLPCFCLWGWQEVNKALVIVRDVAASSCWSHLILMAANYPLRWDPVPAGCHGDIARASVNAGAAAGNHPDPELTGKAVWPMMLWHICSLPVPSPPTLNLLLLLKGPLYISQKSPWAPFHRLCLNTAPPLTDKMEIVYSHDVYGTYMILSGLTANESHVRACAQD